MEIYTLHKLYIDYEYPESSSAEVVGTYANLEEAKKNLKEVTRDWYAYDGYFDTEEELNEFLESCMSGGEECFTDEREFSYLEFNIVHTILIS